LSGKCASKKNFENWESKSRVNCVEIAQDTPRQPAYEMLSIKRRF